MLSIDLKLLSFFYIITSQNITLTYSWLMTLFSGFIFVNAILLLINLKKLINFFKINIVNVFKFSKKTNLILWKKVFFIFSNTIYQSIYNLMLNLKVELVWSLFSLLSKSHYKIWIRLSKWWSIGD